MRTDITNLEMAEIEIKVIADTSWGIDILKMFIDTSIHVDPNGMIRSERRNHIPQDGTGRDYIVVYTLSGPLRTLGDYMVVPYEIDLNDIPAWIKDKYAQMGVTITEVY